MINDEIVRRFDDDLQSKTDLLHELQEQHLELERQNRELREAQQQLEETRDRYTDLYDFSPVGYLTLDESGTVLEINLTGAGMLGKERMNIVGQPFVSYLTTSSIQFFITHLRQIFTIRGNSVTEVMLKAAEGKSRIFSLESMATQADKKICRMVMNDVTEQRKMAVAMQVNLSAQDALLNSIPALVFYLNIDLRYFNISQAFADFIGRPAEEIVGKSVYDLFPRVLAEEFHQLCASVVDTGNPVYGLENSVPDASGNHVWLSTVLAPFRDFQGKVIGLAGVSIDITTIKSAANSNSELLVQNRKLTRNLFVAQEEERRLLARELHDELGQWFTAIQAEAQVICNIAKQAPAIHESALAISKSASAVHEVIRAMLRHLRPTLLDELGLADSLREVQRQWCHSHPDIVCEFRMNISLCGLGEEINITLFRLVQEALNNVARHARAQRVIVNFELEPGKEGETDSLLLRVDDDGVGFDSKQVRAGIGMLGMRERVIAAGGDFYIDSTPGLGTNILARLPILNRERNPS